LIRLKRRGLVSFTIKAITVLDLEGLEIAAITG